jgi:hypothetical protein
MGSPLSPGTKLGRYEIRSQLGAGGMGEVYLATDQELDRTVDAKDSATRVRMIRRDGYLKLLDFGLAKL